MKKLGVCVIGLGFVGGQAHVPSVNKIKSAKLVAVCARTDKRAGKYAAKYGCKMYLTPDQSYDEVLQDPEIDAVIIAVPNQDHYKAAMQCIKAGKHIMLEMPLATNMRDTDKIIEAADKAGVTLMPSLSFRFAPVYVRIKEMIKKEKVLGKGPVAIHYREYISANLLASQWPPDSWAWSKKVSGGPLFSLSVYSIDLFRWLLGAELKQLHSVAENHKLPKFNGTIGYVGYTIAEFTDGTITSMQYSGGVSPDQSIVSMEIIGENTSILTAIDTDTIKLNSDKMHETVQKVDAHGTKMWGHYQEVEHFVNCVLKGKAPDITPEDGRIATEAGLKISKMYRQI